MRLISYLVPVSIPLHTRIPTTYLASKRHSWGRGLLTIQRLTDRWIQARQPPPAGRLDYADQLCPGLHLRITSRGTRSFSAMIRVNGRLQRRTIGRYPVISLAQARQSTMAMLRDAAQGIDPRQPKAGALRILTFAELVETYWEKHLRPNTRSGPNVRRNLLHPMLRDLRTRPVNGILKREFVQRLDNIVATGTPQSAVNVLSQAALAERLGKPQQFVSRYEVCERRLDVIEFADIARAIGVDPIELLRAAL